MESRIHRIPEPIPEVLALPEANKIVSIIIPTWQGGKVIHKAIQSVLDQTYPWKEIIVVDDGSTDDTKSVVRDFPVKYIYQENIDTAGALNRGIKESKGEFLSWLSADDCYIDKDAVKKRVQVLLDNRNVDYVYSNFIDLIEGKRVEHRVENFVHKEKAYIFNKMQCLINGSTLLWRRNVVYNIGLFNPCYRYSQDYDYWYRLTRYHEGIRLGDFLVERTNDNNFLGKEVITQEGKPGKGMKVKLAEDEIIKGKITKYLEETHPSICAMISMKDERQMIEACLDDLIQWVDKIVILDDGSTDDSSERIRKYSKVADVFKIPFRGNIRTESLDRQRLLEMAQATGCDWILFIDSDEVFENAIKWKILDLVNNPQVNLWSFLEINFWRCLTHYRIDEMFYKGWFARLFRNLPGLKIGSDWNEHSGAVPNNIPEADMWQPGNKHHRSDVRVKHYGYAYWDRVVERYMRRMERDPYNKEKNRGGWSFYERMISETGLELVPYEGDGVKDYMERDEL